MERRRVDREIRAVAAGSNPLTWSSQARPGTAATRFRNQFQGARRYRISHGRFTASSCEPHARTSPMVPFRPSHPSVVIATQQNA